MNKKNILVILSFLLVNYLFCQVISYPDSTLIKEEHDLIFTVVEQMPQYPEGEDARIKYLSENIQYPALARDAGIEGIVYVVFVVDTNGSITDPRILRGIGGGCDEEVIRLIKGMPKWIPGFQRGKPVRVQFNMPVKFSLGNKQTPLQEDNDYMTGIEKIQNESYSEALDYFTQYIRKKGTFHQDAYFKRGICYYQLGFLDQAHSDVEAGCNFNLKFNPKDIASLLFLIGNEYIIRENFPMAIESYTLSLKLDPENPKTCYNRGLAYSKSGDIKAAKRDWSKAKKLGFNVPGSEDK